MTQPVRTILIEDEDANRESISRALSKIGWVVEGFAEAAPALEHLRTHPDVSLVVTDLMMPGMDVFEVLARSARSIPKSASS